MWPRRVFRIASRRAWRNARARGGLPPMPIFNVVLCVSATRIARNLRCARRGSKLLCIDHGACGGTVGLDAHHVVVHGSLPCQAVEAVYDLPLARAGDSGMPLAYEGVYLGQQLRDRVAGAPSVGSAEDVERRIGEILDAHRANPAIPPVDVAAVIHELQGRPLGYDHVSPPMAERISAWLDAFGPDCPEEAQSTLRALATRNDAICRLPA